MAEAIANPKYHGKVSAKCRGTAEQVWPFVEDFCNVHKMFPVVATSYKVEGVYGQPGLIRYCQFKQPVGDQTVKSWAYEKLISIDPIQRSLSYEITENNMGFHSYVSTWKVTPINGCDDFGCEIEWSFITGPIDGWKLEDFLVFTESSMKVVAERVDSELESTS